MARKKKEDTSTEEIKKPKAIGPYDIIKMMFTDREGFDKLSNLMLSKNFFMINRILSIQFPEQAQCFNRLNIDHANVIKSWRNFCVMKLGYGRVPSFVYTKGAKASQAAQAKAVDIDKDVKESYCIFYDISYRDFDDMAYFNYNMLKEHVDNYVENIYKPKGLITKK